MGDISNGASDSSTGLKTILGAKYPVSESTFSALHELRLYRFGSDGFGSRAVMAMYTVVSR